MAITRATGQLMEQAKTVQAQTVYVGRDGVVSWRFRALLTICSTYSSKGGPGGAAYKKDVAWNQGLIAAASDVAATVSELVKSANETAQGNLQDEKLVAASKGIAAATTQLVVASRIRSEPGSASQAQYVTQLLARCHALQRD